MKFLGIFNSQNIEKFFTDEKVKNLFQFTTEDNLPIRIGYYLMEKERTVVFRYLAIQMENTSTYETFELFNMDEFGPLLIDEIEAIAKSIADEIIAYNKAMIQYYVKMVM